jgi:DNA-binding MarR family transcriptional regulator
MNAEAIAVFNSQKGLMEEVLIEFINTLDTSVKKLQEGASVSQLTISQFQYIDAIHQLQQPTLTEVAEKLTITKASVNVGCVR